MTASPLISVVTPCLNSADCIEDTIRSVLAQDEPSWEHIVVDRGSSDRTVEILKRYEHLRWVSEQDCGVGDAINRGFRLARGEIFGWLSPGDTYRPTALRTVARELDRTLDRHVIMGRCELAENAGRPTGILAPCSYHGRDRLIEIWKGYSIPQPSVFFFKEVLERSGPIDESLDFSLDYDLFLRFSEHYWFHEVEEVLSNQCLESGPSSLQFSEEDPLGRSLTISRRHWGSRFSASYWRFLRSYHAGVTPIRFYANQRWTRALQSYGQRRFASFAGNLLLATSLFPPLLWRRGQYPLLELLRSVLGNERAKSLSEWTRSSVRLS